MFVSEIWEVSSSVWCRHHDRVGIQNAQPFQNTITSLVDILALDFLSCISGTSQLFAACWYSSASSHPSLILWWLIFICTYFYLMVVYSLFFLLPAQLSFRRLAGSFKQGISPS
ncbi:hypothetical protein SLE2022_350620 [Rubroshorea leprosula]